MGRTPFREPDPKRRLATQPWCDEGKPAVVGDGVVSGSGRTQNFILYSEQ